MYMFVKGCNEATCGPWSACPAPCNTAGIQTRDCTDPVCGVEEEQRPCTGPCKYFLFFWSFILSLVSLSLSNRLVQIFYCIINPLND